MTQVRGLGRHGSERLALAIILAVAGILRLAVFLAAHDFPQRFWEPDDSNYLPIATHLHASYLSSSGRFFDLGLRRPPGYPLFIRAVYDVFGRHYDPVDAAQLVVSTATVLMVYLLAARLLPRTYALLAAALLALDPASIIFANQLMTETLFAFVLTAGLLTAVIAYQRSSLWVAAAAGLLIGASVLIRPVSEYLPIFLVLGLVLAAPRSRRPIALLASTALLVGFLLPTGLWALRNYEKTGVVLVSTIDGDTMLKFNAVGALVESGDSAKAARHDVIVRLDQRLYPGENAARESRAEFSLGLSIDRMHPVGAFKDWVKGEVRLLVGPARSETDSLLSGHASSGSIWLRAVVVLEEAMTLVLVVLAVVCVLLLVAGRLVIRELWMLVAVAAYLVVASGGFAAYSRFRVPIDPIFAVLAASAVWGLIAGYRSRLPSTR